MIRLLLHVFKIKDYEPCRGCEVLRQQLLIANEEKKELTQTLLNLIKPKVFEQPSKEIPNLVTSMPAMTFSRKRTELEKAEKERTRIVKTSPFLARPDEVMKSGALGSASQAIEDLERELKLDNA